MLLSLRKQFQIQYWDEFLRNPLLLLLMGRTSTRSRDSWIQIGWESISNTRSHMRDMERNTMNGYSGTIYWRILAQNPLKIMSRSFMPNTLRLNITQMKSGLGLRDDGLSRKDKKTYSET